MKEQLKFSFLKLIRANDWFYSFVPLIFGYLYLWIIVLEISPSYTLFNFLLLSLLTTFGIAGLGYFINEYYDIEDDIAANKRNRLASIPNVYKLMVFILLLSLTIVPWVFLPSNWLSFSLLFLQCLLYVLYSIKPFRYKKVPFLSNLIDGLYAYLIPMVLSFYTFYLISPSSFKLSLIILFAILMFIVGLRNIFIHQVIDIFNDKRIGQITLPRVLGVKRSNQFILICLVIEVVLFSLVLLHLIEINLVLSVIFIPFLGVTLNALVDFYKSKNKVFVYKPLRNFTDIIYQFWLPFGLLITLTISNFIWLIALVIHLLLFTNFVRIDSLWRSFVNICSTVINYAIFYVFMIFGVNLKLEKVSAFDYIKNKVGK